MRQRRAILRKKNEHGVIITLVAIFMLFVVGAMAALAIDVVSLYTARSEAQLAADSAALTAARVLANSGMTSSTDATLAANAQTLASTIAQQVAETNQVGGTNLTAAQINVTWPNSASTTFQQNPHVTVQITSNLPTFFSRIWGRTQLQVKASATAEAYNSSGLATGATAGPAPPPAPTCVKPWVLPNEYPNGAPMFTTATGEINNPTAWVGSLDMTGKFHRRRPTQAPAQWEFYEGDQTSFPAPTSALPTCSFGAPDPYQTSVVGCVQVPIACGTTVSLSQAPDTNFQNADAVNCLTHSTAGVAGDGDSVYASPSGGTTSDPFQFLGGASNPVFGAVGNEILVSDSLVTVPVYDNSPTGVPGAPNAIPVTVIGFVQLFLNPDGTGAPITGFQAGHINTTIVNMVGCGTNANGPPYVFGNGPSAVPVRLITPP